MIDRFIHDELKNNMREYENGDYVLYEDYEELDQIKVGGEEWMKEIMF